MIPSAPGELGVILHRPDVMYMRGLHSPAVALAVSAAPLIPPQGSCPGSLPPAALIVETHRQRKEPGPASFYGRGSGSLAQALRAGDDAHGLAKLTEEREALHPCLGLDALGGAPSADGANGPLPFHAQFTTNGDLGQAFFQISQPLFLTLYSTSSQQIIVLMHAPPPPAAGI